MVPRGKAMKRWNLVAIMNAELLVKALPNIAFPMIGVLNLMPTMMSIPLSSSKWSKSARLLP